MGSPEFALPSLQKLAAIFNVIGVVTQPDRPAGRGRSMKPPPVKALAKDLNIPVIQPKRLRKEESVALIRAWEPDVIVVAAFGQILLPNILNLPPHGCVNVHASLLPRWRGAAPINAAILHGDAQTGVTIMKMDKGVDTGDILTKKKTSITPEDDAGIVSEKLAKLGGELLVETLPKYLAGEISPEIQSDEQATYAPMLRKEDGRLDFRQSADYLVRMVRAFFPWPGTFTEWEGKLLKVQKAHAEEGRAGLGEKVIHNGLPGFGTSAGILVIDELQLAGKKRMGGQEFLRGVRNWIK